MPETNVNAAPNVDEGQAKAPITTDGQAVEKNSGQEEAVGSPGAIGSFKTPEELYKSYEEIRKDYTRTKQEAAELAKEADTMKMLRNDARFTDWAEKTYGSPSQTKPQAEEAGYSELEELGIPIKKLEAIIDRRAEEKAREILDSDPLRQIQKEQSKDYLFSKAENSGLKDIRSYEDKISDFYQKNPMLQSLPIEHVYKIVAFDDVPNKVKEQQRASNEIKRNASTEGPGMSVTETNKEINTLGDALRAEMKQRGIRK